MRSNTDINGAHPEVAITDKLPLIIHGRQDTMIPVQHSCEASKLIPYASLKIIEECGHNPHLEKPEEFNQAILQFLTNSHSG